MTKAKAKGKAKELRAQTGTSRSLDTDAADEDRKTEASLEDEDVFLKEEDDEDRGVASELLESELVTEASPEIEDVVLESEANEDEPLLPRGSKRANSNAQVSADCDSKRRRPKGKASPRRAVSKADVLPIARKDEPSAQDIEDHEKPDVDNDNIFAKLAKVLDEEPLPVDAETEKVETFTRLPEDPKEGEDSDEDEWGIFEDPASSDTFGFSEEVRRQSLQHPEWMHETGPAQAEQEDGDIEATMAPAVEPLADEESWGNSYVAPEDARVVEKYGEPDTNWSLWVNNSKESSAAEEVVRKIRARVGVGAPEPDGPFPSEEVGEKIVQRLMKGQQEQRTILTALLWLEAVTLDVEPCPEVNELCLNEAAILLLGNDEEIQTIDEVSKLVPIHRLLSKAKAPTPKDQKRKELKEAEETFIKRLQKEANHLRVKEIVDGQVNGIPSVPRLLTLVHMAEWATLKKNCFITEADLVLSLVKQVVLKRCLEFICRFRYEDALQLARDAEIRPRPKDQNGQVVGEEPNPAATPEERGRQEFADACYAAKCSILNRLSEDWRLIPTEDDIAPLHMLKRAEQLHVLLSIERDCELRWQEAYRKASSDEDLREMMRPFLKFADRLRPYIAEDKQPFTMHLSDAKRPACNLDELVLEVVAVRTAITCVLKLLKGRYSWQPNRKTRILLAETDWVPRLAALVQLASKPECLAADQELRLFLNECAHRQPDLKNCLENFKKLESMSKVVEKKPRYVSEEVAKELRGSYKVYSRPEPDEEAAGDLQGAGPGRARAPARSAAPPVALGRMQPLYGFPFPGTPVRTGATMSLPLHGVPQLLPVKQPGTPGIEGSMTPMLPAFYSAMTPRMGSAMAPLPFPQTPRFAAPRTPALGVPVTPARVPRQTTTLQGPFQPHTPAGPAPQTPAIPHRLTV